MSQWWEYNNIEKINIEKNDQKIDKIRHKTRRLKNGSTQKYIYNHC